MNLILVAAAVMIIAAPLLMFARSGPLAQGSGSDDQALAMIERQAPAYSAWLDPIFEPLSGEAESALFAAQAAVGFGFLGWYVWYSRGRKRREAKRLERDSEQGR